MTNKIINVPRWRKGYSGNPVEDGALVYIPASDGGSLSYSNNVLRVPRIRKGMPLGLICCGRMPVGSDWEDCIWSDAFVGVDFSSPDTGLWEGDLDAFYILNNELYFEGVDGVFEAVSKADFSGDVEILVKLKEYGFNPEIDFPSGAFGVVVNGTLYAWSKDILDMGTLECDAYFYGNSISCGYTEIWVSIVITGTQLEVSFSVDSGANWDRVARDTVSSPRAIGISASGYGAWDFSASAFQVMEGCPPIEDEIPLECEIPSTAIKVLDLTFEVAEGLAKTSFDLFGACFSGGGTRYDKISVFYYDLFERVQLMFGWNDPAGPTAGGYLSLYIPIPWEQIVGNIYRMVMFQTQAGGIWTCFYADDWVHRNSGVVTESNMFLSNANSRLDGMWCGDSGRLMGSATTCSERFTGPDGIATVVCEQMGA